MMEAVIYGVILNANTDKLLKEPPEIVSMKLVMAPDPNI